MIYHVLVAFSVTFGVLRRRSGRAAVGAVQITALLVGELSLAALEADMVAGEHHARASRCAPPAVRAGPGQRVAHRGQLILDRAPGGVIDPGPAEVVPREIEEPRSDRAARRRGVARPAAARPARQPDGNDEA